VSKDATCGHEKKGKRDKLSCIKLAICILPRYPDRLTTSAQSSVSSQTNLSRLLAGGLVELGWACLWEGPFARGRPTLAEAEWPLESVWLATSVQCQGLGTVSAGHGADAHAYLVYCIAYGNP